MPQELQKGKERYFIIIISNDYLSANKSIFDCTNHLDYACTLLQGLPTVNGNIYFSNILTV